MCYFFGCKDEMKSDKDKENGWKYLENEDFIDFDIIVNISLFLYERVVGSVKKISGNSYVMKIRNIVFFLFMYWVYLKGLLIVM